MQQRRSILRKTKRFILDTDIQITNIQTQCIKITAMQIVNKNQQQQMDRNLI